MYLFAAPSCPDAHGQSGAAARVIVIKCLLWGSMALMLGCSDPDAAGAKAAPKAGLASTLLGPAAHQSASARASLPAIRDRALRQAHIRTVQEQAPASFNLKGAGDGGIPWASIKDLGLRSWFSDQGLRVGQGAFSAQSWVPAAHPRGVWPWRGLRGLQGSGNSGG